MDVDVHVFAIGQLHAGRDYTAGHAGAGIQCRGALNVLRSKLALAQVDAARERSGVAVDPVVGDLQVMAPAVDEDAAAALGAVGDTQPVDAGRVAHEVAGERVGCHGAASVAERIAVASATAGAIGTVDIHWPGEQSRAGWERTFDARTHRSCEVSSLRQHGDARAFESAHQRWLLQQLRQVAVE